MSSHLKPKIIQRGGSSSRSSSAYGSGADKSLSPSPRLSPYSSANSQRNSSQSSISSMSSYSSSNVQPAVSLGTWNGAEKAYIDTGIQHRQISGVPDQGYYTMTRQSPSGVPTVVHNTGGASHGTASIYLGREGANGSRHTADCQKYTQLSDNRGLCYCPPLAHAPRAP